jgi:hypothetical protein
MDHHQLTSAGQTAHQDVDRRLPDERDKSLRADLVASNLANLDQLEGQVNGDQRLRLAISTLRRQLTAGDASSHGDDVSQETGPAADVVAYLEEHSTSELDEPAAGPTR